MIKAKAAPTLVRSSFWIVDLFRISSFAFRISPQRRKLAHAPATARWTEAAPFAREGDQDFAIAAAALKAGETACHQPTGQKLAQLALDKTRQTCAAAAPPRFGQKGFEVRADHLIWARVRQGRLILDEATDLPEGTVIALAVADAGDELDETERAALHEALARSWASAQAGKARPAEEILAELAARR